MEAHFFRAQSSRQSKVESQDPKCGIYSAQASQPNRSIDLLSYKFFCLNGSQKHDWEKISIWTGVVCSLDLLKSTKWVFFRHYYNRQGKLCEFSPCWSLKQARFTASTSAVGHKKGQTHLRFTHQTVHKSWWLTQCATCLSQSHYRQRSYTSHERVGTYLKTFWSAPSICLGSWWISCLLSGSISMASFSTTLACNLKTSLFTAISLLCLSDSH